jgi:hypothetical protein
MNECPTRKMKEGIGMVLEDLHAQGGEDDEKWFEDYNNICKSDCKAENHA